MQDLLLVSRVICCWILSWLEMWVRGHSRTLKIPFESLGAVSYSPSIVTIGAILYRLRDIATH